MPTLTALGPSRLLIRPFCILLLAVAIPQRPACAQKIFLTPVANRPFSAVLNVQNTTVHKDGSLMQWKTTREIARDIRGRIHNELRAMEPLSSTDTAPILSIHLYDPETRLSTDINVQEHTFWTVTINHPPHTEPPSIGYSDPDGSAPPNEFTKQDDLGVREIEGVPAHGLRQTQTVADEKSGKEVVITDEYWYSQDLRINLVVKHSDPRRGTATYTVAHITRTDPDPALFEIPEGYSKAAPRQGFLPSPVSPPSLALPAGAEKTN
jgi:hypothetical protein